MRLSAAILLLSLMAATPCRAQAAAPRFEIAGGYSFVRDQDSSINFPAGWMVAVAGRLASWLEAVGEAGGSDKTVSIPGDQPKLRVLSFMAGPRFAAPTHRSIAPFAQVLFGVARASNTVLDVGDTVTDFSYQPGAGVDVRVTHMVGARLEADYRIIRAEGSNSKESRFVAAAVFRWGG